MVILLTQQQTGAGELPKCRGWYQNWSQLQVRLRDPDGFDVAVTNGTKANRRKG
jgi:hypothetical protein